MDIDKEFLKFHAENPTNNEYQRAGSCLNVAMILDDMWYLANVGDWRSILSTDQGAKLYQLSNDHKPSDPSERDRVIDVGGKIYVSAIKQTNSSTGMSIQRTDKLVSKTDNLQPSTENALSIIENGGEAYGPHRVLPGRLSVSRAIGDAHAKVKQLGGNPLVVIPTPDIKKFRILDSYDFIVMGSDGLYDKQTNSNILTSIFRKGIEMFNNETQDLNLISYSWAETWVKDAIDKKALDNISCNVIFFSNFANFLNGNNDSGHQSLNENIVKGIKREVQPKIYQNSIPSHLNFDLTDNDLDKTHSTRAIEYLQENINRLNKNEDSKKNTDKLSQKSLGNKPFIQTSNLSLAGNIGINK